MKKNDSDSSNNEVDTDHLESEGSYRYNGLADEPYKPEDPEVAGMDRAEPEVSKEGHMFNESNLESGMGVENKEANLSVQVSVELPIQAESSIKIDLSLYTLLCTRSIINLKHPKDFRG
ncbi:hypothetical protein MJO29_004138 [Puccinia striiformis f. sp. tritici]|nr:hypothetical protein MJO29_004138 [Puccinia striiformis f. sp. tritici]